jgi:hypothetical protein
MQILAIGPQSIGVGCKTAQYGALGSLGSHKAGRSLHSYFNAFLNDSSSVSVNCALYRLLDSTTKILSGRARYIMSLEHIAVPPPVVGPVSGRSSLDQAGLASSASWPSTAGTTLRYTSSYATEAGKEDLRASSATGK